MNILADLFGCFSLLVLASSLRIKEGKSRGVQAPTSWKGPKIDGSENPGRGREGTGKDNEYNHPISGYESFRSVHDVPKISELNRDKLHNASEMKRDIKGIFPHQVSGVTTKFGTFISHIKPYSFSGQKESTEIKFNNLLCFTDCRMADMMVFNLKNQPGNTSFPFQNMALAGRPYSFSKLKNWCEDNCSKRSKIDASEVKEAESKKPNENDAGQFPDEKPATSNTGVPFISFGAKPPGLLPPIPPVIPTIFFPPMRNFYPYTNIIATPLLYRQRNDRRVENTGPASGVGFRSFRDNSPKTVPKTDSRPYRIHQRSRLRGQSYSSLADYNAFRESKNLRSNEEKIGKEKERQQVDDITEKTTEKTKYDEEKDSYEDTYYEGDYDDEDEDDERIDSVVRFLREVSRILSNKAFRVLLKRSSSCDSIREPLPEKEQNNTDLHRRGLHEH